MMLHEEGMYTQSVMSLYTIILCTLQYRINAQSQIDALGVAYQIFEYFHNIPKIIFSFETEFK